MEIVRTGEGSKLTGEAFQDVRRRHRIKPELTTANDSQFNEIAERALGIIEKSADPSAGRIEALLLFPDMDIPKSEHLWVDIMAQARGSSGGPSTTANPTLVSPHDM